MIPDRLIATLGSAFGNFTLFGAVIAGWPGIPPWTESARAHAGQAPTVVQLVFRPYIVEPAEISLDGHRKVECPRPAVAAWQFELVAAPLPARFDPRDRPGERLYACLRLNMSGEVLAVSTIGVSEPAVAAAITEKASSQWLFSPRYGDAVGWAKVRINAGRPETPSMPGGLRE